LTRDRILRKREDKSVDDASMLNTLLDILKGLLATASP
jgi:hypothetical protein